MDTMGSRVTRSWQEGVMNQIKVWIVTALSLTNPHSVRWHRPTVEVVGISGGFSGEGIKTVIPRKAFAKLACRLVPGQKPKDIYTKIQSYILSIAPPYAQVTNCQSAQLPANPYL